MTTLPNIFGSSESFLRLYLRYWPEVILTFDVHELQDVLVGTFDPTGHPEESIGDYRGSILCC